MRLIQALVGLASLACLSGAAPADGPHWGLERVVVVARHGVRSPTKSADVLSKYSAERWPDWPVGVGELTPHGGQDVRLMGAWLRHVYADKGLWPATGCPAPGQVFAWADGADQRTRASGDALLAGAFPGCGLGAAHGPEGETDALFDGISSGACPIDPEVARTAVLRRAGGDLDHPAPGYDAAKDSLGEVLAPDAARRPCPNDQGVCFLSGGNRLVARGGELRLEGPLGTGATLTESLLLEYAEGMPAESVGWGRAASSARIAAIMPVHEIESDLMRRTPYLAVHNGGLLARAVMDAIDGRAPVPGQGGADARFVLFAGHDTNLSNLAGILGLDWTLRGQPDKTAPDTALVFEVWRDPASGERIIKTAVIYQTLDQLRGAVALDDAHPAGRVETPISGCDGGPGGACLASTLRRTIEAAIPSDCRR